MWATLLTFLSAHTAATAAAAATVTVDKVVDGSSAALPFIRTGGLGDPFFYDDFNRARIFHGVNRVKKAFPWYFFPMMPPPPVTPDDNNTTF